MPTIQQIEKIFAPYRNKYGFVTCNGDVDHSPLFHGFYLLILEKYGLLDEAECRKQRALFKKLIHPDFPGILLPRPYHTLHTGHPNWYSHDTHKAMFWISHRVGLSFAKDFLEHGRKHGRNWNPKDPKKWTKRGTYWRFPSMIAQAKIAAGEKVDPLHLAWLYTEHTFAPGFHKRNEKFFLPLFIMRTLEGYGGWGDVVVNRWRSKKKKAYPNGLSDVLKRYGKWWRESPYIEHTKGIF